MAKHVWRIVFDDIQEQIVYADDLTDVLNFIGFNQTELLGHDGVAHLNIQINKLTEDEVDQHFNVAKANLNYRDRTPESYEKDEPFLPTAEDFSNWVEQSKLYQKLTEHPLF
ncbi:hypothetical protein SEA_NICEHOUSE_164 [Rhodococcus phage NiceHouse]|nr:hypothetical protein SEA_NICEHOUSE_164 [Rhodococcus phage NiceHouse]